MKVLVIFLVLLGFVGFAYAEPDELQVPEPTLQCPEGTILKEDTCIETEPICGKDTTYQDGVCVVNESNEKTISGKWTNSYQNTSQTSQEHGFGIYENLGIFYSKNGTELIVLKKGQEVDVIFQYEFRNDKVFDGYVYYNIAENGSLISQSQNFTVSEIPKVFKFIYNPQNVGKFSFTKGSMSHSGIWGGEQGRSIIVLEEFSKAMEFNGQCKKPFPEYTLAVKHDFSTAACVKHDTKQILVERGWADNFKKFISNTEPKFLSKTITEWKSMTQKQLMDYHDNYHDSSFFSDLGRFLIKDAMRHEIEKHRIQNKYDDFTVYGELTLTSLPSRAGFSVVNATNQKTYCLEAAFLEML